MIPTNCKVQEIDLDLWGPHNPLLLLEKYTLAYYSTNSPENHVFSYFKVSINSLTPSNPSYHKFKKPAEKSFDIYKLIEGENSLIQYLKTFVTKKLSISAMRLYIYI